MTADHAEGMIFSGYNSPIGSDIMGVDRSTSDVDLKPYPILTYAAGPGNYAYEPEKHAKDTFQPSTIPKSWGNHGGEDVPLFAAGPLASTLFTGTIDQTYIPQAISYALCISIHSERCNRENVENNENYDFPDNFDTDSDYNPSIENFSSLFLVNRNDSDVFIEDLGNSSTSDSNRHSKYLFLLAFYAIFVVL